MFNLSLGNNGLASIRHRTPIMRLLRYYAGIFVRGIQQVYLFIYLLSILSNDKRITCKRVPRNTYTWIQVDTYN